MQPVPKTDVFMNLCCCFFLFRIIIRNIIWIIRKLFKVFLNNEIYGEITRLSQKEEFYF